MVRLVVRAFRRFASLRFFGKRLEFFRARGVKQKLGCADASRERESVAMSKNKDDNPPPKEWQARHDAACAIVARKYCDMFKNAGSRREPGCALAAIARWRKSPTSLRYAVSVDTHKTRGDLSFNEGSQ
jgi:hypothetical protein